MTLTDQSFHTWSLALKKYQEMMKSTRNTKPDREITKLKLKTLKCLTPKWQGYSSKWSLITRKVCPQLQQQGFNTKKNKLVMCCKKAAMALATSSEAETLIRTATLILRMGQIKNNTHLCRAAVHQTRRSQRLNSVILKKHFT